MIEFYILQQNFIDFKTGSAVPWTQSLSDFTIWTDWPKDKVVKLRISIDEVEFVPTSNDPKAINYVKRVKPFYLTLKEGEIVKV